MAEDSNRIEHIRRDCECLDKYLTLMKNYPDFREAHLRLVGEEDTLGQGDETKYVDQEYKRLTLSKRINS